MNRTKIFMFSASKKVVSHLSVLTLAMTSAWATAAPLDCSPATPRTTVIYCNDFETFNTAWVQAGGYVEMDGTPIASRYGGTEIKSPTLSVDGASALTTGVLIRQQASVETIKINNPSNINLGQYSDVVNTGVNHAIGMFANATGTVTPDKITFTFDALDKTPAKAKLPFIVVELDAATIPLMRPSAWTGTAPIADTVISTVSGVANQLKATVYDESLGDLGVSGAQLNFAPLGTPVANQSIPLALSATKALGDTAVNYAVVWKKIRLVLDVRTLQATNLHNTVTLLLDYASQPLTEYAIFDNLKITATDDQDGDGVPDAQEVIDGTDPTEPTEFTDTDGDGVPDYVEVEEGTDPNDPTKFKDTDGDGVPDYVEIIDGTYPTDSTKFKDTDNDGVPDYVEVKEGTNPTDPASFKDTDGDLVPDYVEIRQGTNPNNPSSFKDSDGDLVPDYVESVYQPNAGQPSTNPNNGADFIDTDGGGAPDYVETILAPNLGFGAGNIGVPADDQALKKAVQKALAATPHAIPTTSTTGLMLLAGMLAVLTGYRRKKVGAHS